MRNVARLKMGFYPLPEGEGVTTPRSSYPFLDQLQRSIHA